MKHIQPLLQARLDAMSAMGTLFVSEVSGHTLWKIYLSSFKEGDDPVYRCPETSTHNCTLCGNFIRRYGNIVALTPNLEIITLWNMEVNDEYAPSFKAMNEKLQKAKIQDVFFESFVELNSLPYEKTHVKQEMFQLGFPENVKVYTKEEAEKYNPSPVKANQVVKFNHLSMKLNRKHVIFTSDSIASYQSKYRSAQEVYLRALSEISIDTTNLVRDLIVQRSILNGETYVKPLEAISKAQAEFATIPTEKRTNWVWHKVSKSDVSNLEFYSFRNTLLGTLCVELTEGKDLVKTCEDWNKRVDPANYKKAVAPFTKKQLEEAQKMIDDGGYADAFDRRLATLDDISTSEILHINSGTSTLPGKAKLLDNLKPAASTQHKRQEFDKIETVGIEKFMKDILPGCTRVQVYLENRHKGNFVTMTTAKNKEAKSAFAWGNNFSWTYAGNLAGKSMITEAVKKAGGKIDAPLRMSLMWNSEKGTKDNSDLDLWCEEAGRTSVGFSTRYRADSRGEFSPNGGQLDVDNTWPGNNPGVENIYYRKLSEMKDGTYQFYVHMFAERNSKGFQAELKVEDQIFQYSYPRKFSGKVHLAKVVVSKGQIVDIKHDLTPTSSEGAVENIYGLDTLSFHDVSLVCLSPNHWNTATGHKHYFFMLRNCRTTEDIRSFHSENLNSELLPHRRVLEALGNSAFISPSKEQLSGLGFNATVADTVVVKLEGTHKRVVKIQF